MIMDIFILYMDQAVEIINSIKRLIIMRRQPKATVIEAV